MRAPNPCMVCTCGRIVTKARATQVAAMDSHLFGRLLIDTARRAELAEDPLGRIILANSSPAPVHLENEIRASSLVAAQLKREGRKGVVYTQFEGQLWGMQGRSSVHNNALCR